MAAIVEPLNGQRCDTGFSGTWLAASNHSHSTGLLLRLAFWQVAGRAICSV